MNPEKDSLNGTDVHGHVFIYEIYFKYIVSLQNTRYKDTHYLMDDIEVVGRVLEFYSRRLNLKVERVPELEGT